MVQTSEYSEIYTLIQVTIRDDDGWRAIVSGVLRELMARPAHLNKVRLFWKKHIDSIRPPEDPTLQLKQSTISSLQLLK